MSPRRRRMTRTQKLESQVRKQAEALDELRESQKDDKDRNDIGLASWFINKCGSPEYALLLLRAVVKTHRELKTIKKKR